MTLGDPPRLKNEHGLPAALGVALHTSPNDGFLPSADAVNDLERALTAALAGTAGLTAASTAARGGKLLSLSKLVSSKGGVAVLHMLLGAAVGVGAMEAGPAYRALTSTSTPQAQKKLAVPRSTPPASNPETAQLSPAPATSNVAEQRALPASTAQTVTSVTDRSPGTLRMAASAGPSPNDGTPNEAELREVDLIERAHRALPSDPQRALAWLREDERRFPNGTFAQERDAIAIEALVGEGDMTSARARAAQFLARFPGSAYAAHVASLVRTNK